MLTVPVGYPSELPLVQVEGRRGVKNEALLAMRNELDNEAKVHLLLRSRERRHFKSLLQELRGMAMAFALAEKLKQLLDTDELPVGPAAVAAAAAASAAAATAREEEKPRNHQVGEPLITHGTRCTENVFMEWREVSERREGGSLCRC